MRKFVTLSLTVFLGIVFLSVPAFATNCSSGDKFGSKKATSCDVKAKTIKAEMKTEEMEKDDGLALATFTVNGMTCGGCEAHVGKTLKACKGVSEVVEVSHKDNMAVVKYDPSKIEADKLASTITELGYKAEVKPAVAKTTKEAMETEKKEATKDM